MFDQNLKVKDKDAIKIAEDAVLSQFINPEAEGLRIIYYAGRLQAEQILEWGLPFGTGMGAKELAETTVPLMSTLNEGTLRYQPVGESDSMKNINSNLLATRRRTEKGWTDCVVLIIFPDSPDRYAAINKAVITSEASLGSSREKIYIGQTYKWLNYYIDFSENGQQLIPRSLIAGFIDLPSMELVRNIHYGESFIQSDQARVKLQAA